MNNIASPWRRLLSYLIDWSLALLVPIILVFIFSTSSDPATILNRLSAYLVFLIFAYPVINALLTSFLISSLGGTLGKLLTGSRIVRSDGKNLSFMRAFFRNFIAYQVSAIFFRLGFIWILIDKERRGWHDQIADTFVIVKNKWVAILGAILLIVFLFAEFAMITSAIVNFASNGTTYNSIVSEIQTSLQPKNPSATE